MRFHALSRAMARRGLSVERLAAERLRTVVIPVTDGEGSLLATASQSCIVRMWRTPADDAEQLAEHVAEVVENHGGIVRPD